MPANRPRTAARSRRSVAPVGWVPTRSRWPAVVLALVGSLVYANSLSTPLVFDDVYCVTQNATIRHLWPLGPVMATPTDGSPAQNRPLVNASLAVNYALASDDGLHPWGYHVANVSIHLLAGIALFGLIRRTLELPPWRAVWGRSATNVALAASLVWIVHPLATEAVTYISGRPESLMALCYLFTLYATLRGATSERSAGRWYALAVLSCGCGMASKEVMVTAPVVVLLYDRVFLAGAWGEVFRRRWELYVGLVATWGILAACQLRGAGRAGSAGFGQGMSSWDYACTQAGALVHYLRLCIWPRPLVIDYGSALATTPGEIVPYAIVVALLLAACGVAWRVRPAAGFLGLASFIVLAPSSSVVPVVTQTMAERRMYLPLAALVTLAVAVVWRLASRATPGARMVGATAALAVVALFAAATVARNEDYRSATALWEQTVGACPANPRAHVSWGRALAREGDFAGAIREFERALAMSDDEADVLVDYAAALVGQRRLDEGLAQAERALALEPDMPRAHEIVAIAAYEVAQSLHGAAVANNDPQLLARAESTYRRALTANPRHAESHANLALIIFGRGMPDEARQHLEAALALRESYPEAHYNLAVVLESAGQHEVARRHAERAMQLRPNYAEAAALLRDLAR